MNYNDTTQISYVIRVICNFKYCYFTCHYGDNFGHIEPCFDNFMNSTKFTTIECAEKEWSRHRLDLVERYGEIVDWTSVQICEIRTRIIKTLL